MRDPKRIDKILEEIRVLWNKYPDLRLGQIIYMCMDKTIVSDSFIDVFYFEDDLLLKGLSQITEDNELVGRKNEQQ